MRIVNFNVDEAEWQMFRLKTGHRTASSQLRELIVSFNNGFKQPDPEKRAEEMKIREKFRDLEKEYNQLKTTLIVIDAARKADEQEQERKAKEIQGILDNAAYETAKDMLHYKALKGDL